MLLQLKFRFEDEDYKIWSVIGLVTPFYIARVKATGTYTVLSLPIVRFLESTKRKKLRQEEMEQESCGSHLYFSSTEDGDAGVGWQLDPACNVEDDVITKILFDDFLETLTEKQLNTLYHVLILKENRTYYAKSINRDESTIREAIEAIRKKIKKFFD